MRCKFLYGCAAACIVIELWLNYFWHVVIGLITIRYILGYLKTKLSTTNLSTTFTKSALPLYVLNFSLIEMKFLVSREGSIFFDS